MSGSQHETSTLWRQRSDDLSWREIEDSVIVLDLRSAVYLRLNAAGAVLWARLERGATEADLTQAIVERFGIEVDQATTDVSAFLQACADKGLIQPDQSALADP